jgi:drug/metabolite transporter (DMT)-like permease
MKKSPHVVKAEAALFFITFLWGGTFVLIKSALVHVSPMVFVSVRFGLAALVLLPFVIKPLLAATRIQYKKATILGISLFIGFATQTIGLRYTTATKSAFLTGMFVIITPIMQIILEKRKPTSRNLIAILLGFFGILFLSSRGTNLYQVLFELGTGFNFGDFLTLICAVNYSWYIVYLDMLGEDMNFKFLTFIQIFVTMALALPFIYIFNAFGFEKAQFEMLPIVIGAIVYTAIFTTILSTLLQTKYQKDVTPTRASIIFSMEPMYATVFALFLLGEKISIFGIIGCCFIFSGVLISELTSRN